MTRLIISLFLLAYAFTSLSAAAGTAVWLDHSDGHAGHELHIPGHEDDVHDDEAEHHFCHHNLLGLAINLPAPGTTPPRAERLLETPDLYRFECLQRLLRPPRR